MNLITISATERRLWLLNDLASFIWLFQFSSPPRVDLCKIPSIVLFDEVGTLLGYGIGCRHDVAADVAWEDRCIDDAESLYAFHFQSRIYHLPHRTRSNQMILRRDVSPDIVHPGFFRLDALALGRKNPLA
jgi:hypothetical protein